MEGDLIGLGEEAGWGEGVKIAPTVGLSVGLREGNKVGSLVGSNMLSKVGSRVGGKKGAVGFEEGINLGSELA